MIFLLIVVYATAAVVVINRHRDPAYEVLTINYIVISESFFFFSRRSNNTSRYQCLRFGVY